MSSVTLPLERLERSLGAVLAEAKASPDFRASFAAHHKSQFAELFVKLGVQARSRKDARVRDLLDECWVELFTSEAPLPQLPAQEQKLIEIFPGTSIADAIKLVQKHETDKRNLQVALKYLEAELTPKSSAALSAKQIKPWREVLGRVKGNSVAAAVDEVLGERLAEITAHERAKANAEERRRAKLEASSNPAAKRALSKMAADRAVTLPAAAAAEGARPKKQTDEEWEREYLKRARLANQVREEEEARSRKLGRLEDLEAEKDSSAL
ncbi:hypothetical protein BASA81_001732 [Batrachochytrium salamandrivorans]|nr:hypothetical protein BASA81_001732 [Batrachochytrium salamandrivorans]